jgi:ATP-dependent RNA helicase DHX29
VKQTGRVTVDGWLEMNAPAQTAVLFKELRVALNGVLQERIGKPQVPFPSHIGIDWRMMVLM